MKLTYEQKVQIYHDWKSNRMSVTELAEHYHIALSNIKYLVELADRHGVSAVLFVRLLPVNRLWN